jgi:hypothetical protein
MREPPPVSQKLSRRPTLRRAWFVENLVEALFEDAASIAEAFNAEQKQQLGIAEPDTPLDQAMWDAAISPDWKREQLEKARQLAAWSRDPRRLADEAREFPHEPDRQAVPLRPNDRARTTLLR